MRKRRRLRPVQRFVAVVSAAGVVLLVYLSVTDGYRAVSGAPAAFWLFAVFVAVGELFPITVQRADEVEEIATSTTFAFALMLGYGGGAAVLALAAASAVADLVHRKQAWKILFNVGQYTLSMGAAAAVYGLLGGTHRFGLSLAGVSAAVAFFVVNDVLTGVAVALAQRLPVFRYLASDALFQATTAAALLAMAPVVRLLAEENLAFVFLAGIPVAAIYRSAKMSLENTRLVARLEGSLAHMTELNRLKDDFVAVVSHELRTPLTSIQGYIKTLIQLSDELGEEQRRSFLEAADRQSDRLRRLIEQLLIVGRLESHVEPLTVSPLSLGQLTRHVVDELRPLAHGHTFDVRLSPNLPLVETDEAKVHQILTNLIENALKYSPPDTRITIRGREEAAGVAVSVEDEGPGIPPDSQERVFERFYQADQSTTRSVGGTGLGLYICKKLAENIGARLWLERSGRDGSEFRLLIPFTPPGDEDVLPQEEPAEPRSEIAALSR